MNDIHDNHEPSAAFRASLRQDMLDAFRRERQFGATPVGRARRAGMVLGLATGAVAVLSVGLVLGAGTGLASAAGVEAQQRAVIASNVAATRQFAAVRLDLARAKLAEGTRGFANHATSKASLDSARADVRDMEALVARIDDDFKVNDSLTSSRALLSRIPMRNTLSSITCAAIALAPQPAPIETPVTPVPEQQGIPTIDLPAPTAKTPQTLGALEGVRQVADGKLLVNDAGARQLRLFDSTLSTFVVTLDSTTTGLSGYPAKRPRPIPLSAYRGDSSILPDPQSRMIRVIDGAGRVARTASLPAAPVDLSSPSFADESGRLLFTGTQGWITATGFDNSTPIVRVDLVSGRVDTLARLGHRGRRFSGIADSARQQFRFGFFDSGSGALLPDNDDWALLSNGTVAIVRGQDYHIDWIRPDGGRSSTGKLPFDWNPWIARLARQQDSARAFDSLLPRFASAVTAGRGNVRPKRDSSRVSPLNPVTPLQLKLYSVTGQYVWRYRGLGVDGSFGDVIPDLDGNLWILPTGSAPSSTTPLIYDVVNAKGELFQRVRVAAGRSIVAFGKDGAVYLASGDRTNGFVLERTRLVKH